VFSISKAKISSWDNLKKMKEEEFQLDAERTILLRGVTEGERRKAQEDSTERKFNQGLKEYETKFNEDVFAHHLIMAGWVEPIIPGETFDQKKEGLDGIPYNVLKKIARKIDALSDIQREDIEAAKNDLDLA